MCKDGKNGSSASWRNQPWMLRENPNQDQPNRRHGAEARGKSNLYLIATAKEQQSYKDASYSITEQNK